MKKRVMTAACSAMLLGTGLVAGSESVQARTRAYPALNALQAQASSSSQSARHRNRPAPKAAQSAGRGGGHGGVASWYGPGFHGRRTASGERFNAGAYTAAHRTLPFGTRVMVTNRANGRSVVVRINDRGPFSHGRIIDLSQASARAIGLSGTAAVALQQI